MKEVLRAPRRSKAFTLDALQTKLGKMRLKELTRERLIQFGKDRAQEGAGPATISMDIGYIKLVVSHAAAVHGIRVQVEPVDLARIALKRLGLVGKGRERDRRPTLDELQALTNHFENNDRQVIPIGRLVSPLPRPRAKTKSAASAGRTSMRRPVPSSCATERIRAKRTAMTKGCR